MPTSTLSLNEGGVFNIFGTVDYSDEVTIASETAIKATIEATTPRKNEFNLDRSASGIVDLIECYQSVTGADIDLQRRIVARGGKDVRFAFPFVWAAQYLLNTPGLKSLESVEAWEVLTLFGGTDAAWSHHPRYGIVACQMAKPGSFFHTAFTFMTAHYLYLAGNKIGLALEDKHGEANPDLYVRGLNPNKSYIEVKSPRSLQASGLVGSPIPKLQSLMKETTKRASGQINRRKPGILVVASSYIQDEITADIVRARDNTIQSLGRLNRGLAGLVTISPRSPWKAPSRTIEYAFDHTINPYFDGANPLG